MNRESDRTLVSSNRVVCGATPVEFWPAALVGKHVGGGQFIRPRNLSANLASVNNVRAVDIERDKVIGRYRRSQKRSGGESASQSTPEPCFTIKTCISADSLGGEVCG